jgi:hypothetical protein
MGMSIFCRRAMRVARRRKATLGSIVRRSRVKNNAH